MVRSEELEAFIQEIMADISELSRQYPNERNIRIGRIGELVIGRGIKKTLLDMGYRFRIDPVGEDGFNIGRQYNADENEIGGVDFLVKIWNDISQSRYILVEVKNWSRYAHGISPDVFNSHILERFSNYDPSHEYTWVVTINKDNIDSIREECQEYNIHLIPLDEQLTDYNITRDRIRHFFINFIGEFGSFLLREFSDVRPIPYQTHHNRVKDGVIYDFMRGVPKNVIARVYGTSINYVNKILSEARRNGIAIPDRRRREWRDYRAL